jgi:Lon protease-like protein
LVYWYWDTTYSIVDAASFIPYKQGKPEWMQVPQSIQDKLDGKSKQALTTREEMIVQGLQQAQRQVHKPKSERSHYQKDLQNVSSSSSSSSLPLSTQQKQQQQQQQQQQQRKMTTRRST